jgi:hypothetical protein
MNFPAFYRYLQIFKFYFARLLNVQYYSVYDLQARTGEAEGDRIRIDSYYANGTYPTAKIFGWELYWNSAQAKSGHNGITVHSPTVPWDGTQAALSAYHAGTGETDPSGTGCWVMRPYELNPYMAGAVGGGTVDDNVALQNALTYCVTNGIGFFVPTDTFLTSAKLNVTGRWNIYGAGFASILRTTVTTIPLIEFNINTTSINRCYLASVQFSGPQSTNVNSCALLFSGDNLSYITNSTFENIYCSEFNAFVKVTKDTQTTSFGEESMLAWNIWSNIHLNNVSSYGWWFTKGSGTGNTWDQIKPQLRGAGAPTWFFDGAGCVVGDILIHGDHNGGRDDTTGSVALKIGEDTVYRSRICIEGSQFDANCDTPLDLSSTGSDEYESFKFVSNNMGGSAELSAAKIPYMSQSVIEDKDVDLRQTGRRIETGSTGALTTDCFKIGVNSFGSSLVTVQAYGLVGGIAATASEYQFYVTTNGVTMTIKEVSSMVHTSGQLVWTCTSVDVNNAKLTLAYAPSSGGTKISTVAIARGHNHKLTRT